MVFVYIRIYFAARARARRCVRKPPKPKPQLSSIEIEDTTNRRGGTKLSSSSDGGKSHKSQDKGRRALGSSSSVPPTPDGRIVKQVGFQEPPKTPSGPAQPPLTKSSLSSSSSKPEITVETCSPEDSMNDGGGGDIKCGSSSSNNNSIERTEPSGDGGTSSGPGLVPDQRTCCGDSTNPHDDSNTSTDHPENETVTKSTQNTETKKSTKSTSSGDSETTSRPECCTNDGSEVDTNLSRGHTGDNNNCDKEEDEEREIMIVSSGPETIEKTPDKTCDVVVETESAGTAENGVQLQQPCTTTSNYGVQQQSQPLVPTIHLKEADEPTSSSLVVSCDQLENSKMMHSNGGSGSRADELLLSSTTTGTKRRLISTPPKKSKRPNLHFLRVDTPSIWRTSSSLSLNGDVHILGTLSRSCSRLQLDTEPVSDVDPSSSDSGAVSRCAVVKPLKLRLCQPFFGKKSTASSKARRDALDIGKISSPKVNFLV